MWTGQTIRDIQRQYSVRAYAKGEQPYVPASASEIMAWHSTERERFIPFLGDYRPPGWTLLETVFVDMTGVGRENELAMTIPAFFDWAAKKFIEGKEAGYRIGFAVVERGQLQAYIGLYSDQDEDVDEEEYPYRNCPSCYEPVEIDDNNDFVQDYCPWCDQRITPQVAWDEYCMLCGEEKPYIDGGDEDWRICNACGESYERLMVGSIVIVPEPAGFEDLWNHTFEGVVVDIWDEVATVEDGDRAAWDVDIERLRYPRPDPDQMELDL